MKRMRYSKTISTMMLTVLLMTGVVSKAEAKFWGNETTSDWVGTDSNGCMVQYTNTCYFAFWFPVSCSTTATVVDCDDNGPSPCSPSPCPD